MAVRSKSDVAFLWVFALLITFLASLPRIVAWVYSIRHPDGSQFLWLGSVTNDPPVYLSWAEQSRRGAIFQFNEFTSIPQSPRMFNVLFAVIGWIAAATGASVLTVYELARVATAVLLIFVLDWFLRIIGLPFRVARLALVVIGTSAGLGWTLWFAESVNGPPSVDTSQIESITFQCIEYSAIFLLPMILMLGCLGNSILAERNSSLRSTLFAGLCAMALGNIHGYDLMPLTFTLVGFGVLAQHFRPTDARQRVTRLGMTLAMGWATGGYVYLMSKIEPVFSQRVAVPTLSAGILPVLLGYGLLIPFAVNGARKKTLSTLHKSLLGIWTAAHLFCIFLPVAFQRKMIMGLHIPIAILAACGLYEFLRFRSPPIKYAATLFALAILSITNLTLITKQIGLSSKGDLRRPGTLRTGEIEAMKWVRDHSDQDDVFQVLPIVLREVDREHALVDATAMMHSPWISHRRTSVGHWGETPNFKMAMAPLVMLFDHEQSQLGRRMAIEATSARFIMLSDWPFSSASARKFGNQRWMLDELTRGENPLLKRVFENADASIYEVIRDPVTSQKPAPAGSG